jgi:hypothetical protein
MKILIQISIVIVTLLVGNVILHFAQELWHSGSNEKIESLESKMSELDNTIKMYEAKSDYRDGLSEYEYKIYEDAIDQYNIYVDEINELYEKTGTRYYIR